MNGGAIVIEYARQITSNVAAALIVTMASMAAHAVSPMADPPESPPSPAPRAGDTDWPSSGGLPSVAIYALPNAKSLESDDDPGDADKGRRLFNTTCVGCHGEGGTGGAGPALAGIAQLHDFGELVKFIERPRPPMPKLYPDPLSAQDVRDVARYLSNLR
jgi:mono/diheme cytochrome c family protein